MMVRPCVCALVRWCVVSWRAGVIGVLLDGAVDAETLVVHGG